MNLKIEWQILLKYLSRTTCLSWTVIGKLFSVIYSSKSEIKLIIIKLIIKLKRCEYGAALKKEIVDLLRVSSYDLNSTESFDTVEILKFFEDSSRKEQSFQTISKVKDYQEIEYHRHVARMQRESYNTDCRDFTLLSKKILIEFDYKEKLIVGICPREIGSDFYNRKQVSLLGFGIYYSDQDTQDINCIHVDLVTDVTIQDGYIFCFYKKI